MQINLMLQLGSSFGAPFAAKTYNEREYLASYQLMS